MSFTLLHNKSSFEVLYNKLPSYKHLRSYRCLFYASTLISKWETFTPRARACILLGYPIAMKAYKLLDIELNRVFNSWDVVFYETIFPLVKSSTFVDEVSSLLGDTALPLPAVDFRV